MKVAIGVRDFRHLVNCQGSAQFHGNDFSKEEQTFVVISSINYFLLSEGNSNFDADSIVSLGNDCQGRHVLFVKEPTF